MTASQGAGANNKGKITVTADKDYLTINDKHLKVYSWKEATKHFGYIYITRNNINNKLYLGLNYKKQKGYLGSGKHLKNAIKCYGKDNFVKYIIDFANNKDELEDLEVYYICHFFGYDIAFNDNWYNITSGRQRGGNSWAGYTEKEREERIHKQHLKMSGRHPTEETLYKMSKAVTERFKDKDERKKTSRATRAAMNTKENSEKILHGVDLPLVVNGKEYWNFSALAREYNLSQATVNDRYRRGARGSDLVALPKDNHDLSRWGHLWSTPNKIKENATYAKKYFVYVSGYRYTFISGSFTRLARLVSKYTPNKIGKNSMSKLLSGEKECFNGIHATQCAYISDEDRLLYSCAFLNGNSEGILLNKEEYTYGC